VSGKDDATGPLAPQGTNTRDELTQNLGIKVIIVAHKADVELLWSFVERL